MPTIDDLLEHARRYGVDGGSCFGVTDSSRLRPPFRRIRPGNVPSPPICDGCEGKKHHDCKKKVKIVWIDSTGVRMKLKRKEVPCECTKCKK